MHESTLLKKETKFFFVLYAASQINSFVKSGILKEISESIDVTLVVEKGKFLESIQHLNLKVLELEPPIPVVRGFSGLQQLSTLWRFKDRTMNHLVRAYASFGTEKQRALWKCVVVSEMKLSMLKRGVIRVLSHTPLYALLKIVEETCSKFFFEKSAFREISRDDIVLIPYSGHLGPHFNPWIRGANRRGIRTIAIQENWDNLSTKAFITEEPTYFCVWGRQSAGHLRNVHRLFKVEPWIVGSPRFDLYFNGSLLQPRVSNWSGEIVELNEKTFVLVAGTGDGLDDEILIKVVSDALFGVTPKDFRLVYRPHPMTRTKLEYSDLARNYPELLIDAGPEARIFGHHDALVRHAKVVVNHFSTLTVESVLAGTKVITPLFLGREDANYRYGHILNEWHHMMGLALVSGIHAPESIFEMKDCIRGIILGNLDQQKADISWICESNDYIESLLLNINRII